MLDSPKLSESDLSEYATTTGHVASLDQSNLIIEGTFNPGLVIDLYPGQPVYVFTAEALDDFASRHTFYCNCDES